MSVWVWPSRHSDTNDAIPSMALRSIRARWKPFWIGITATELGSRASTTSLSKHFVVSRTIALSGGRHPSNDTNRAGSRGRSSRPTPCSLPQATFARSDSTNVTSTPPVQSAWPTAQPMPPAPTTKISGRGLSDMRAIIGRRRAAVKKRAPLRAAMSRA